MLVKITFYGYPDNDDGAGHFGTSIIAHALTWKGRLRHVDEEGLPRAGGTGTFDDPITAAASRGNHFFPPRTLPNSPALENTSSSRTSVRVAKRKSGWTSGSRATARAILTWSKRVRARGQA